MIQVVPATRLLHDGPFGFTNCVRDRPTPLDQHWLDQM